MHLLALSVLVTLMAPLLAAAEVCKDTNQNAPTVGTLMAAMDNDEAKPAWVVLPDCSVIRYALEEDGSLTLRDIGVYFVENAPPQLKHITFKEQPISYGGDFSAASKLESLTIDTGYGLRLDQFALPASVLAITIISSTFYKTLDELNIPNNVYVVRFDDNELASFKNVRLPKKMLYIYLSHNRLTSIDFEIPEMLQVLEMRYNNIAKLERVTFPDSIILLEFGWNPLTEVRGVKWPKNLESLRLEETKIVEFEIRRSDLPIFQRLNQSGGTFSEPVCTQPTAEVVEAMGVKLCVIEDALFQSLYEGGSSPDDVVTVTPSPSETPLPTTTTGDSDSKMSTALVVVVVVLGVVVVVLAALGYRALAARKGRQANGDATGDKYTSGNTPTNTTAMNNFSTQGSAQSSQEYLSNDIRNDKYLLKYRIEQSEISLQRQIARGGFGAIFQATYQGRFVAIKQMLPDTLGNDSALAKFMDEIRLCATFDHPKIVSFIGVAWSSLRDLSVVIEYMPGGDLSALLQKHAEQSQQPPSPRDWLQQWTPSFAGSKASIAQDVAEAVVYLHSFSAPILHRDLKARNVLLDERGNAKLSDFGISREMAMDETMTSGVGTVAWIAPEVLRGERYTEMADMYSLGVLLVELDRCCHPYANVSMSRGVDGIDSGSSVVDLQHKNTQIVVLVSTGQLRPSTSAECPEAVRSLVNKCLSFDPSERPTAMEAAYALRRLNRQGRRR